MRRLVFKPLCLKSIVVVYNHAKFYKLQNINEDFMAFSYKKTKYDRHLGFCK